MRSSNRGRGYAVDARADKSDREQWSTRSVFVLATAGSAVGLGNIWRFPYLAGENGGGAFIIVYLGCLAMVGIPLMMAEAALGRCSRMNPVDGLRCLAGRAGASAAWGLVGFMGILAAICMLSLYSVVAGWSLAYLVRTASGVFSGVTGDGARSIFSGLISDPERLLGWHTVFMVVITVIVAQGVRPGLERAVKFLMPALLLILVSLLLYSWRSDTFEQGLEFLLTFDFGALSAAGVYTALGQAFFTLSVGMGAIMAYGSYLPDDTPIAGSVVAVVLIDTLVALMAGLVIFPIVFSSGLSVGEGPGLVFQTLPIAFGRMSGGVIFGSLFFLLLLFAALSSGLSLMQPAVAWISESGRFTRGQAATAAGLLVWLIGIIVIMSFSAWSFEFSFAGVVRNNGVFDLLDILTAGFLLPLGGIAVALFAGRVLPREMMVSAMGGADNLGFSLWYVLIRYLAPLGVVLVFLRAIGVI